RVRKADLGPGDIAVKDRLPCTSPVRTVIDCAEVLDREGLCDLVDSALCRKLMQPSRLIRAAEGARREARGARPAGLGRLPVELEKLGDGVWAWLQPGGGSGISNAGVVADDDGLTVVDCLMVRSQWEPFAAAVAALGQPVRRLVLTHAHIDHVGGTKAFPLASVLASPATSALLDQPLMIDGYKAFMPAFADEFDDLAEVGTRPVTHEVVDGAPIGTRLELIPAAGHTPGDR